jgi:hypothetical protein
MTERRRLPRRILDRFWYILDSESVTSFQMLYYVIFCAAGIYGVFIAGGSAPLTLQDSMPHFNILLWYWLNVAGPAMAFVGISIKHTKFSYPGLWLQLGGNGMFALALLAYMHATFGVESWGRGMYGAFPLATSSFASTSLLLIRDVRRIFQIECRVRSERD